MEEFRINKFLSLRLEGGETIIYVSHSRFLQCAFLLLNINVDEMTSLDEIESIDDAAERLDKSLEGYNYKIPPEVEFWGHCSNLQVWYEHDYDTRLIHSNLAFPLLKKLTEAGDPLAKRVFKEEIIKRYRNGTEATREFLEIEGFLENLTLDERLNLMLDQDNFFALMELSEEIPPFEEEGIIIDYPVIEFLSTRIASEKIKIENKKIIKINLSNLKLHKFPKALLKFKALEILSLRNNKLSEIPQDIDRLKNLREIWLSNNILTYLPNSICNLKKLEKLWVGMNHLRRLPDNIGDLTELKSLQLSNNFLKELPKSICKLRNLEFVNLSKNLFKEYPEELKDLQASRNSMEVRSDLN